jgi:acyl-CoA synthetase (AMP-forming)/AMP-acid ligase II
VFEAAVWLRDDEAWGAQLEAAAAPRPGARLTPEVLAAHLAAHLPPHALPARLDVLDQLPRTATGKVDRRALSARIEGAVTQAATN